MITNERRFNLCTVKHFGWFRNSLFRFGFISLNHDHKIHFLMIAIQPHPLNEESFIIFTGEKKPRVLHTYIKLLCIYIYTKGT